MKPMIDIFDMEHPAYFHIGHALKAPIYSLTRRNNNFGTGFEVLIEGNNVTLQLMDDKASVGKVIHELKATSDKVGFAFLNDIAGQFETQLFELE